MREENKLIAEFMGFKLQDNPNERFYNQYFTESNGTWGNRIEIMHFDSSWDWLMLVVEKIEQTNNGCTLVIIEDERCYIDNQNGFEIDSVGHTKIEAVYNAVIKFIKLNNHERLI